MKVCLRDFSQNKGPDFNNIVPFQVYACLYELTSNRIVVSATLDYIAAVIRERRYELVEVQDTEVR